MFEWGDKKVRVQAKLIPRYLWSTASIDVYLEDECILRTGGQLKFIGTCTAPFTCENSSHRVVLKYGLARIRFIPFQLEMDGTVIAASRAYIQNWMLGYVTWLVIGLAAGFFLTGLVR